MARPQTTPPTSHPAAASDTREAEPSRALPPRSPYEDAVVGILGEVLGCHEVAVHDRLLDLGDVAEVPHVVAQIRRTMGVDIPVADYVEAQTVAGLASAVSARSLAGRRAVRPPSLGPRPLGARQVLSYDQQRLWMENQLLPGSIYNVHGRRRIRGALDVDVLQESIRAIVGRHETLRTRFPASDTAPLQVVDETAESGALRVVDLGDQENGPSAERAARDILDEELERPFDLESGPLLRCVLIRLADDEHVLGITMHHIVSDAWSIGLFVRELTALYRAGGDPGRAGLDPLVVQYRDYAVWQREWLTGEALELRLRHWREHLEGAPRALALPTAQRRTDALRAEAGQVSTELPLEESAALHALCRDHGVTSFMVLYAAFATLLARWSGQRDIVVGVPVAGRSTTSTDRLIGFFVNLLPLRVDLSDDPPFARLLERVRAAAVDAYAHTEAPMDELVRDLGVERDPRRTPLFEAVLNVVGSPEAEEVSGLAIELMDTPSLFSRYDLNLTAQESGGVLRLTLDFPADRCDEETGRELLRQLRTLVGAATSEPRSRLLDAPVGDALPPAPAGPDAPQAPLAALHGHTGDEDRVAVVDGGGAWSYQWMTEAAGRVLKELAGRAEPGPGTIGVVRRPTAGFVAVLSAVVQAGFDCTVIETDDPALTGPLGLTTVLDPGPVGGVADGTVDIGAVLPARGEPVPRPEPPVGGGGDGAGIGLGFAPQDRVVVLTARPGHVVSAACSAFEAGATLLIPDRAFGTDVGALADWLREHEVSVAHADAPILRALSTHRPPPHLPALRCVVVDHAGDLLPHDVEAVRELAPGCRFVAVYRLAADGRPAAVHEAPAELAVADAPLRVPLGVPRPGAAVELRRESGVRAAVGELGEIWCGGERTGDAGRLLADGTLELTMATAGAVVDDPTQTLSALRDAPGVSDAVVLPLADRSGGTMLVGYVAGPDPESGPAIVQGHVKAHLPDHLVPRQVLVVDALPRTPWGEYDLRALPRPGSEDAQDGGYAAPRTPVERRLAGTIEELLEIERVGVYDSFFELGGFSMLATQLITRVRDGFGVQLAVRDVFESPTVDELAPRIVGAQAEQVGAEDLEELLREVEQA